MPEPLYDLVKRRLRGASLSLNTYALRRGLGRLPRLVRRQRRLERKADAAKKTIAAEKACRDEILVLLEKAGCKAGDGVTCLGFDLVHRTRQGNSFISRELLLAAGVAVEVIDRCVDRHASAKFATVSPMKGAELEAAA